MSSPRGIMSPQSRPALTPQHSSGFKATSLAVAAARRFTTASSTSVQSSAIDLSPSPRAGADSSPARIPVALPGAGGSPSTAGGTISALSPSSASPPSAAAPDGLLSPRFAEPDHPKTSRSHSPRFGFAGGSSPSWARGFSTSVSTGADGRPSVAGPEMRRRSSAAPKYKWLSGGGRTGDEPGVDVRSGRDEEAYGHLKAETKVTVVDYSSDPEAEDTNVRIEFKGSRLGDWLDSAGGQRKRDDEGRPVGVRWIHVEGLNWEVIKTLTLHFNLHPLAVEDALRSSGSPRSKLDFYRTHLYMQVLVQHMHPPDEALLSLASDALSEGRVDEVVEGASGAGGVGGGADAIDLERGVTQRRKGEGWWKGMKRNVWRRKMMKLPEGVEGVFEPSMGFDSRGRHGHMPIDKHTHRIVVDQLSAKYMIPVRRGVLSVFLTRDGTLISMSQRQCNEVLDHIYDRLEDEHSLLRRSGDPSMLAHAILDVVVDLSLEISQAFESEILKLESSVLVDPEVEIVRHLHILSSQLIRLRRTLAPLLHVCYIVRDQDVQRAAAASTLLARTDKKLLTGGSATPVPGSGSAGLEGHSEPGQPSHPGQTGRPGQPTQPGQPGQSGQAQPPPHSEYGPPTTIDPTSDALHLTRANQWSNSPHHSGTGMHHTVPQVLIDGLPDMTMSSTSSLSLPLAQPAPVPYSLAGGGGDGGGGRSGAATPTPGPGPRDARTARPGLTNAGSTATAATGSSSASGPGAPGSNTMGYGYTNSGTVLPLPLGPSGSSGPLTANHGVGFFSPMTKVYIGDVIDHLELVVGSMDQFVATCDHLTDYVFNSLSFQTNASMERLSIVTVVFLPLTFIASYFGMNFEPFPALENGEPYFWKIAAPCTVGFFLIFSFTYLRAGGQTIARRVERWRRTKAVERVRKMARKHE